MRLWSSLQVAPLVAAGGHPTFIHVDVSYGTCVVKYANSVDAQYNAYHNAHRITLHVFAHFIIHISIAHIHATRRKCTYTDVYLYAPYIACLCARMLPVRGGPTHRHHADRQSAPRRAAANKKGEFGPQVYVVFCPFLFCL